MAPLHRKISTVPQMVEGNLGKKSRGINNSVPIKMDLYMFAIMKWTHINRWLSQLTVSVYISIPVGMVLRSCQ